MTDLTEAKNALDAARQPARIADALERIADTQSEMLGALLRINAHIADLRDVMAATRSTVSAEMDQYRHATELQGRPMHAALKVSAPKGFICPGCGHYVSVHRMFGCDQHVADEAVCPCDAPYGRPPHAKPAEAAPEAKAQMSLKDMNSGIMSASA